MSLLSQFYNCSGGGTVPDGVPSGLQLGGMDPNNPTARYFIAGPTAFYSTPFISANNIREGLYTTANAGDDVPVVIPRVNNVFSAVSFGIESGQGGQSGQDYMVFVNCLANQSVTPTWVKLSALYGGSVYDSNPVSHVFTSTSVTKWGLGAFYFFQSLSTVTFNMSALADVTTCGFTLCGGVIDFSGCPLSQASVDHILQQCVDNTQIISMNNCALNLGGLCSSPSAAGLANKAILLAPPYSAGSIITN